VKAGKFLVVARGGSEQIARAKTLLAPDSPEHLEVFEHTAT
jgi:hypothetical protein